MTSPAPPRISPSSSSGSDPEANKGGKPTSYILTIGATSLLLNFYHAYLTGSARRSSGIGYPTAYASAEQAEKDPKAFAFNCAQRAHANYTESLTPFLGSLLIAGLVFPRAAVGLGATWVAGRAAYARGYAGSGPGGRLFGFYPSLLAVTGLQGLAVAAGVKLIQ